MKLTCKFFIFVCAFLTLTASAHAQSPREQLTQLAQQLQATPNDNALRERVIRLGAELKPAPTIPEEANRAFVKGGVFQKEAKDAAGSDLAVSAYRDALRIAPWWGDAYFNLAVALESANRFDEAIAATRSYLASVPAGGPEAREAQNRIYALEAKGELARKQAAASAVAAAEARRPTVEGRWSGLGTTFEIVKADGKFVIIPGMHLDASWQAFDVDIGPTQARFGARFDGCPPLRCGTALFNLSLSSDGDELAGSLTQLNSTVQREFERKR